MFTLILLLALAGFVFRMVLLSIRMTWGLSRILLRIVFFPITLLFLLLGGFLKVGLFLLIIYGIISLFSPGNQIVQ